MAVVNDGYIHGEGFRIHKCGHCGERTACIKIEGLVLPEGVSAKATILQDRTQAEPTCITHIGVGCGSYAKFHRQITHIVDSRMRAGHAV